MEWYRNLVGEVEIIGRFDNNTVTIVANYQDHSFEVFSKSINFWSYQEPLPEDILRKYQSKVSKIEKSIPKDPQMFQFWLRSMSGG